MKCLNYTEIQVEGIKKRETKKKKDTKEEEWHVDSAEKGRRRDGLDMAQRHK